MAQRAVFLTESGQKGKNRPKWAVFTKKDGGDIVITPKSKPQMKLAKSSVVGAGIILP